MLRRITLENFMSHQHTVIDLADGLTVLTGPNNCGKSAVVAALQILASNGKSTHVMRHGEKICRITAETDDGHVICWQRKKASVSYTLDGEDIHRVGQSVPEGLQSLLRLPIVHADSGSKKIPYDIHFGEQKSPVFLLGDPGSRAASFFAAASDASRLLDMTVRHRSNVKDGRQTAKRITSELAACDTELLRLKPVEELETRLANAEERFSAITQAIKSAERLAQLRLEIQKVTALQAERHSELQTLKRIATPPKQHNTPVLRTMITDVKRALRSRMTAEEAIAACTTLAKPPEMQPTAECRKQLKTILGTAAMMAELQIETATLQKIQSPPPVHATEDLKRNLSSLKELARSVQQSHQETSVLKSLIAPQPQHDTNSLRQTVANLKAKQHDQENAARASARLTTLAPPSADTATAGLQELLHEMTSIGKTCETLAKQAETCRNSVAECESRVREFVDGNPRCTTCGAELDPERLLNAVPGMEAHHHG